VVRFAPILATSVTRRSSAWRTVPAAPPANTDAATAFHRRENHGHDDEHGEQSDQD
jgi:hypothetical protein